MPEQIGPDEEQLSFTERALDAGRRLVWYLGHRDAPDHVNYIYDGLEDISRYLEENRRDPGDNNDDPSD